MMSDSAKNEVKPLDRASEEKYQSALLFFEIGRFEQAADILEKVAKMEPDSAAVHLLLARSYLKIPRPGEADDITSVWVNRSLTAFKKAIELAEQLGGLGDKDRAAARNAVLMLGQVEGAEHRESREESGEDKSSLVVALGAFGLSINDRRFDLPAELHRIADIIGQPTRVSRLENDVHTWDSLGLRALCNSGRNAVIEFDISLQEENQPFSPQNDFQGTLIIEGEVIIADRAYSQLKRLGFQADYSSILPYEKLTGEYHILIGGRKHSDRPVVVAISRASK